VPGLREGSRHLPGCPNRRVVDHQQPTH
jgi:hypothetical protein